MVTRRELLRSGMAAGVAGLVGVTGTGAASARLSEFVRTSGADFTVGGEKHYFNGTNNFWIQDNYTSKSDVDAFFELASQLDLNIVRTWGWCSGRTAGHCLQPRKGEFNEAGFEHFDYVIEKAAEHDIRLVIPFTDNWSAYGGMGQYVEWSPTASNHDDFYTDENVRQMYREFVEYVLTRENSISGVEYREDPTIAMWELANEPRAVEAGSEVLGDWFREMSGFIKDIDSNHLVSTGSEGHYQSHSEGEGYGYNGHDGAAFIDHHKIDTIDACSFHLYPHHWNHDHAWGTDWIRHHLADAREEIGKPAYLGEFGVHTGEGNTDESSERASTYGDWYNALMDGDAGAAMFWELVQSKRGNHDGFSVHIDHEQTVAEIEDYTKYVHDESGSHPIDPPEDTTAPTAPSNFTATDTTDSSVSLSWNGSTDEGSSGLDHYVVSWEPKLGAPPSVVDGETKTVPAGTTSTTISNLSSDQEYAVGVWAVDGAGNESDQAALSVLVTDGNQNGELTPIEGKTPTDPDGDGHYEDLNGNGRIDSDDVVTYFENKDDAAITDHVDAYDYNENDRIDYDDVASLFDEV